MNPVSNTSPPSNDLALVTVGPAQYYARLIWDGALSTCQFMWDAVYEGNHPAKQLKYQCLLAELAQFPSEWISSEISPIQKALRCLTSHEIDYRKRHHEFLKYLRNALKQNPHCEIAQALVQNMYNAKLYSYTEGLVLWAIMRGYLVQNPDSQKTLEELTLLEMYDALQHIPQKDLTPLVSIWYHSLSATLGISFDPTLSGNIPYHLFDLHLQGKTTSFIRSASPVLRSEGSYQLVPEYQALLGQGKRVQYISLQSPVNGAEGAYSNAIRAGFEGHDFIVLDHDSPFYHAAEGTPDSSVRFRLYFLNQLFNSEHFIFPESWAGDKQFKNIIEKTLDQIAEQVFEGKVELTKDEKKDFIDIFYSYLIFLQIGHFKPDIVTICCRDAADRHGKVLFLFHLLVTLFEGKTLEESSFERIVLTFAPPLIGRKKPMLHSRFKRLYSAMQRLTANGVPDFLTNLGSRITIDHTVTRCDYQTSGWENLPTD